MSFVPTFDPIAAAKFGLSRMELETRMHSIRGSDCNTIVNGSDWEIRNLIAVKRGEVSSVDLSKNKACLLGTFNEALNVMFFEMDTELRVYARNTTDDHPFDPYYGCSVDGKVDDPDPTLFEAKYTGATNLKTITKTYLPQLTHNMDCCGLKRAILSVIMGGTKYGFVYVDLDLGYLSALRARTEMVWRAIQSEDGQLEGPLPDMPKPVLPEVFRATYIDLTQTKEANRIAALAPDFLRTYDAAKLNRKVSEEIKKIISENEELDADLMDGFGMKVTTNAAGARSLAPADDTNNKD